MSFDILTMKIDGTLISSMTSSDNIVSRVSDTLNKASATLVLTTIVVNSLWQFN